MRRTFWGMLGALGLRRPIFGGVGTIRPDAEGSTGVVTTRYTLAINSIGYNNAKPVYTVEAGRGRLDRWHDNSNPVYGRNNGAAHRRKLAGRVHRRAVARKKSGGR